MIELMVFGKFFTNGVFPLVTWRLFFSLLLLTDILLPDILLPDILLPDILLPNILSFCMPFVNSTIIETNVAGRKYILQTIPAFLAICSVVDIVGYRVQLIRSNTATRNSLAITDAVRVVKAQHVLLLVGRFRIDVVLAP